MIRKQRKNQKAKIVKREERLGVQKHNLIQKEEIEMNLIDAAQSAFFTDGIESFDYKLNYNFEE